MGDVVRADFGLREIRTLPEAMRLCDEWQRQAERMEMLYDVACIQRDCSEALVCAYERELERLRGLIA